MLFLRVYCPYFKFLNWPMQDSIEKKVFKKIIIMQKVIITCLLPIVICGLEGKKKRSHLNVAEQRIFGPHQCLKCLVILFCISEVLCNKPLAFFRARCVNSMVGLACFRVILLTGWFGLKILWVLNVLLWNSSSLAQLVPVKDGLACQWEYVVCVRTTGENRCVMKYPSSPKWQR